MKMLRTIEINPDNNPTASVIILHGLGASGDDFADITKQLNLPSELNVRFVLPHAPIMPIQFADGAEMRAWFDIIDLSGKSPEDEAGIRKSQFMIEDLINHELERNIPSEKIILAGFSQGGAMALQCGLRFQKKLAGILVLSSWLPLMQTVIKEQAEANKDTPIMLMHGNQDNIVPLAWGKKSCDYLNQIGYNAILNTYTMQHSVCPSELVDIGQWLKKLL